LRHQLAYRPISTEDAETLNAPDDFVASGQLVAFHAAIFLLAFFVVLPFHQFAQQVCIDSEPSPEAKESCAAEFSPLQLTKVDPIQPGRDRHKTTQSGHFGSMLAQASGPSCCVPLAIPNHFSLSGQCVE